MQCPCQSGLRYEDCCGRFISGQESPQTAQQLMRSRYSAYVVKQAEYLRETWYPSYRPAEFNLDDSIHWVKLDIIDALIRGQEAEVEFEALFLAKGQIDGLHERSRFVYENGRWFYTTGTLMPIRFKPWKPGRNESCPCGSGHKFKRCCAVLKH